PCRQSWTVRLGLDVSPALSRSFHPARTSSRTNAPSSLDRTSLPSSMQARVEQLADSIASKAIARKGVRVRIPSRAPQTSNLAPTELMFECLQRICGQGRRNVGGRRYDAFRPGGSIGGSTP